MSDLSDKTQNVMGEVQFERNALIVLQTQECILCTVALTTETQGMIFGFFTSPFPNQLFSEEDRWKPPMKRTRVLLQ